MGKQCRCWGTVTAAGRCIMRTRHWSRANDLNNSKQAAVSVFHWHSQQVPRHKSCSVRARHNRGGGGGGDGGDGGGGDGGSGDVLALQRASAPVFLSPERLKYLAKCYNNTAREEYDVLARIRVGYVQGVSNFWKVHYCGRADDCCGHIFSCDDDV
jgi:hypothetical protein